MADKIAMIDPEKSNARKQPSPTGVRGAAGQVSGGFIMTSIVQRFQVSPRLVSRTEILTLQRTIGNTAVGQLLRRTNQYRATPIQRLPVMGAHGVVVQRGPGDPESAPDADVGPTPSPEPAADPTPAPDPDIGPTPAPDPDAGSAPAPDADVGPTSSPGSDAGPTTSPDPDSDGIDPSDKGADPEDQEELQKWNGTRGLTSDELADAQGIYMDSIEFDKVAVEGHNVLSSGATRTIGNTIYFGDEEFEGNTSTLTPDGRSTLIHELGHVWQFQHGGMEYIPNALGAQAAAYAATGDRSNAYVWRNALNQGLPWAEWNAEQQAEAIQDYHDAKGRIAAKQALPDDQQTVQELEPYIGQVRNGLGAPGGPSQAPGDYPEEDPNHRVA